MGFMTFPPDSMIPNLDNKPVVPRPVATELPACLPSLVASMKLSQEQKVLLVAARQKFTRDCVIIRIERQEIFPKLRQVSHRASLNGLSC